MKLERVVIATDFSERSIAAARWTAHSFAREAEVVLVHVLQLPRAPRFLRGSSPLSGEQVSTWRSGAQLRLRQLARQIGTGARRMEVRTGRPDEQVLAVAKECDADLIAVGSHRDRAGLWNRLGTTAERIVAAAPVPVLVAHGAPQDAPRLLLGAIDDSASAWAVIEHARALAHRFGARGKVTHVLSEQLIRRLLVTGEVPPHDILLMKAEQSLVATTHDWLAKQLAECSGSLGPSVLLGDPAEAILAAATRAGTDLIILGRERKSKARRLLLGSVSGAVLRGARCPVLVIPPGYGPKFSPARTNAFSGQRIAPEAGLVARASGHGYDAS